ncbi:alpha/beta hydrolase family protein [Portibacter marinus]|uniref:alpha/beta hydrolase family protein n=1 Tax=Portibacter marinus TaxID=2898660 RepID=UPI001F26A66F|nr:dienelactone hydrolase family protein [Portibacter marinus]
MKVLRLALFLIPFLANAQVNHEFIFGDALPDAPTLAERGEFQVGVRTLDFINKNQIDILNTDKDGNAAMYDRDFKVEVWYPATLRTGQKEIVEYEQVMGSSNAEDRPIVPFTFKGRAARDAAPQDGKFPLIIVSHGYLGSRVLMTYLTENLASKGYIVAAIDHKESTFQDAKGFISTLLNRPKDILFILNSMIDKAHFASEMIDQEQIGLIGYSMGGYGVLNVGGAGYSDALAQFVKGRSNGNNAIASLIAGHPDHQAMMDPKIKCIVAFAPWGMNAGMWDEEGLSGLRFPTLFIAGSEDDISGYENGVKAIYEGAVNTDRYMLTYMNARHNVAPNPPAPITMQKGLHFDEYYRYAEPSWDERRINNINQHFITAFLGTHLKNEDYSKYLDLPTDSNKKTWEGFLNRTSTGMLWHSNKKSK